MSFGKYGYKSALGLVQVILAVVAWQWKHWLDWLRLSFA